MTKVFLSYRRIDTAAVMSQISKALCRKFGRESVFMDVDSIPPGSDFREAIRQYVNRSNLMLAVIGRQWLEAADYHGVHRLSDPTDWVRIEVEAALARDIPIIPVLVDGATMPAPDELPAELRNVSYRQSVEVGDGVRRNADIRRLLRAVEKHLSVPVSAAPPPRAPSGPATEFPSRSTEIRNDLPAVREDLGAEAFVARKLII